MTLKAKLLKDPDNKKYILDFIKNCHRTKQKIPIDHASDLYKFCDFNKKLTMSFVEVYSSFESKKALSLASDLVSQFKFSLDWFIELTDNTEDDYKYDMFLYLSKQKAISTQKLRDIFFKNVEELSSDHIYYAYLAFKKDKNISYYNQNVSHKSKKKNTRNYYTDMRWVETSLPKCQKKDPSDVAQLLCRFSWFQRKWAEKIIENSKVGDPSSAARFMVRHNGSSVRWCLKILKKDKIGDPSSAAFDLCMRGYLKRREAERIIEKDKVGESYSAAKDMVENCGSSEEWYKNVLKNNDKKTS